MSHTVSRVFYPVGQGAFYSEIHKMGDEKFTIVYDCGSTSKEIINKVIKNNFNKKDSIIDVLFISHFDMDHISGIETLISKVKEIKTVILPGLYEEEKILLVNFYNAINENLLSSLISNPEEVFGAKTKIIFIDPSSSNDGPINIDDSPLILEDLPPLKKLSNGSLLRSNAVDTWLFIPYNYADNQNEIERELEKEGFDIEKFKNNSNYTLTEIAKDASLYKSQGGKKLRGIYNSLKGGINDNSMFLYSGPSSIEYKYSFHTFNSYVFANKLLELMYIKRPACVYTGDGNLNKVRIAEVFKKFWKFVGTIQVPHHGSKYSFDNKAFKGENNYICPVSFGNNNSCGHPSTEVLTEIFLENGFPVMVTERADSIYIQAIKRHAAS